MAAQCGRCAASPEQLRLLRHWLTQTARFSSGPYEAGWSLQPLGSGRGRTAYSLMAGVTERLRPWVMILTVLTPFVCAAWQVTSPGVRLRVLCAGLQSGLCERRSGGATRLLKGAVRVGGASACAGQAHRSVPNIWKLDNMINVTQRFVN